MHVSRRSFDRRIDLKWFREDLEPVSRSNFQKNDFWPKMADFSMFFESHAFQFS